jgi:tubulin---tyrosine ligase
MRYLWEHWGEVGDEQLKEIELYSINVPMIDALLTDASLPICWTTVWRNSFPRLFKPAQPEENSLTSKLQFRWAPDMRHLITPPQETLPVACDAWALSQGWVSVTPLTAAYGEPQWGTEGKVIKLKL